MDKAPDGEEGCDNQAVNDVALGLNIGAAFPAFDGAGFGGFERDVGHLGLGFGGFLVPSFPRFDGGAELFAQAAITEHGGHVLDEAVIFAGPASPPIVGEPDGGSDAHGDDHEVLEAEGFGGAGHQLSRGGGRGDLRCCFGHSPLPK